MIQSLLYQAPFFRFPPPMLSFQNNVDVYGGGLDLA